MKIENKIALVTGAGSGIGQAVARELIQRSARLVVLVDRSDSVFDLAETMNKEAGREVSEAKVGDTTNDTFRTKVYDEVTAQHGVITICVRGAEITRDAL